MWPSSLMEQGQVSLQPVGIPVYVAQPYAAPPQTVYPAMAATAANELHSWAVAQAAAHEYGSVNSSSTASQRPVHVQQHTSAPYVVPHSVLASPQHQLVHGHTMPQAPGSPAIMMTWHPPHLAMPGLPQQHTNGLTAVAVQPVQMPAGTVMWQAQQQHNRMTHRCFGDPGVTHKARQQQLQQPRTRSRAKRCAQLSTKPGDVSDAAFEEFASAVNRTPASEQLNKQMVEDGLQILDSRGLAALLKELAKGRHGRRAKEVFEYLRSLPADNPLAELCDVFTYTAMVSLCVEQQELARALELVQEMKQRGIERNVHTYTALMNVAIKCGHLHKAQEVYSDLLREGCVPNVVTYNTLIDLYGKTGQWGKALRVIQQMLASNIKPVTRTYNTLMIACNTGGQWQEALNVYAQMVQMGHVPNTTTYNALISAYSKAGRLEKVMESYQEMLQAGCERSVITYSTLISACEKAGQWQLALDLFDRMLTEKCDPNVITYNSLITACAQGAQWSKAAEVFQKMKDGGCKPDVVTYTALVSAYERGGQWTKVLEVFQQMQWQGCGADAILYNTLLDILWDTGIPWAQQKAGLLMRQAVSEGHYKQLSQLEAKVRQQPQQALTDGDAAGGAGQSAGSHTAQNRFEIGLKGLSPGVAVLMLHCWFADVRDLVQSLPAELKHTCLLTTVSITTGRNRQRDNGSSLLQDSVLALLAGWHSPFEPNSSDNNSNYGRLGAAGRAVADWLMHDEVERLLAPFSAKHQQSGSSDAGASSAVDCSAELAVEAALEQQCKEAYAAVKAFEETHNLSVQSMSSSYMSARCDGVKSLLEAGCSLGLSEDVVHDAVLLMDRGMSAQLEVLDSAYSCLAAACLHLTLQTANLAQGAPGMTRICSAVGCSNIGDAVKMVEKLKATLQGDTSSVSALHCLKLYLQRLGCKVAADGALKSSGVTAELLEIVSSAALEKEFLNYRPTITAAAVLYCYRLHKGLLPVWPSSLSNLTGYSNARTAELAAAIWGVKRLLEQMHHKKKAVQLPSATKLLNTSAKAKLSKGEGTNGEPQNAGVAVAVTVSGVAAQLSDVLQLQKQQRVAEPVEGQSAAAVIVAAKAD